jgi:hypothetical protein
MNEVATGSKNALIGTTEQAVLEKRLHEALEARESNEVRGVGRQAQEQEPDG